MENTAGPKGLFPGNHSIINLRLKKKTLYFVRSELNLFCLRFSRFQALLAVLLTRSLLTSIRHSLTKYKHLPPLCKTYAKPKAYFSKIWSLPKKKMWFKKFQCSELSKTCVEFIWPKKIMLIEVYIGPFSSINENQYNPTKVHNLLKSKTY